MTSPSHPSASSFASLPEWLASLDVTGVDPALLLTAFTHPSFRTLDPAVESYERLEFLGDAVLNLIVADILFRTMPAAPEGVLTERRAALVNRKALAAVFDGLGLVKFLRAAPGYVPSLKDKGNVVEALFGAILIGRDFSSCCILWHTLTFSIPPLPGVEIPHAQPIASSPSYKRYQAIYQSLGIPLTTPHNAKNALQELCQKQGLPIPTYEEATRTGPDHHRYFHVRLVLHPFARESTEIFEATGEGLTLTAAEIQAAERLCDQIALPYTPQ